MINSFVNKQSMRILIYLIKIYRQLISIFILLFIQCQNALLHSIPLEHFIDIRFLDFGMEEDEEDDDQFNDLELCAKIAWHKINSLKFPKGIEGDALKAHFLLRERMLAKCPLYGYLEGDGLLRMAILDEGFGGNLEWLKRAHPECASKAIYLCPRKLSKCPIFTEDCKFMEEIEQRRIKINYKRNMNLLNCLPTFSVNIFLQIQSSKVEKCEMELDSILKELNRILCPGGYFCCASIHSHKSHQKFQNAIADIGFRQILMEENITPQVCRSMLITWHRFDSILEQLPFWLRPFKEIIGKEIFPNYGRTFEKLRNKELFYLIGCWQKIELD